MVSPKDVRTAEEDADVMGSVRRHADELAKREGVGPETRKQAERVAVKAGELLMDLNGLKDHMERNEDIA